MRAWAWVGLMAWVGVAGPALGQGSADQVPRPTADVPLIAVEDDWPPFAWVPQPGAPVQGFAVAVVRRVFQDAGVAVELRAVPFGRCMHEARTGAGGVCFTAVQPAENKSRTLGKGMRRFYEPRAIFARDTGGPGRPVGRGDLAGHSVGFHQAYHYADWFTQDQAIRRVPAGSDLALLQMLQRGRVDYVMFGASAGAWRLRTEATLRGARIRKVGEEPSGDGFWMAFSRQHPESPRLLQVFDRALRELQASPAYRELQRQHLPGVVP